MNKVTINGVDYVPLEDAPKINVNVEGLTYCIIRTFSAGVHAGFVKERCGKEVTLVAARRLWQWAGAFTLSEIAVSGVKKPKECKFSTTVPEITLTEAIEIIPCTNIAYQCIKEVEDYEP